MATLHFRTLYRGSLISITDVRCRTSDARCGADEYASAHELIFTRTGVFVKHTAGRQTVAEAAQVLFFNEGEEYRVSHPAPGGDDCTVLAFPAVTLTEVLGRYDPAVRDRWDSPFSIGHAPASPRVLLRQQRLRHHLRASTITGLEVEESALEILHDAIRDSFVARGVRPQAQRPDTLRSRRDVAEATKLLLASDPTTNVSLDALARAVARSPFHLARLFRDEVGLPIHQYLMRLRLALSLERLADDSVSLSRLALDLGFSSHSHFSSLFARTFGVSPSSFRRTVTSTRLRGLRKILKA